MTWKCVIDYDVVSDGAIIRIAKKNHDGSYSEIVGPLTLHTSPPYTRTTEDAMLNLPIDEMKQFLQSIVDAAWSLGVQPKGVKDYESSNKAQKYHLEDMRSLVKRFTEAELPKGE